VGEVNRSNSRAKPAFHLWLAIVAVFVGLAAGYASTYAATATTFILPLTRAFGWGRMVPALMFVSSMLGIALASVWIGPLIERFGEAVVAAVSGAALAIVMALLSTLSGVPSFAVGLCFLAGLVGSGTSAGLYLSILPRFFDRHLGRALGLSIIGLSTGVILMPTLAAMVIPVHGWRYAYRLLATVELVLTLATALALLRLRGAARACLAPSARSAPPGLPLSAAVKTRSFWILSLMVFLASAGVFGASIEIFPLYADRGVAPGALPRVAMTLGLGTLIGRLTSGFQLDHMDARIVAAGTFFIGAFAILWLALSGPVRTLPSLYCPPVLIGMSLGAESDVLAYLARRLYGLRHYAAIYNRLLISYYLGTITGPLGLGWAFDHLPDSRIAIAGLAVSCLGAASLAGALPSPRRAFPAVI
jgi:OFA family oxalate/formate antiporter-like MFS transporter